ncbi:protein kinase domain-containing protein [Sorangium sp. So ce1151]|uniref:protein kinase domain-containing protein n=1 Tax=Sorangium sp. So ce1151 TaxID=3133332 RepID=UPI003F6388B8
MDYRLGEVLYTGAETRVVAGVHRSSQAAVVLKIPRHELPDDRVVARLRGEHALLRKIELPGIVRALDLVPHGAGVALVLERWGDGSLERALASGPLPLEAVLRLGAALARLLGQLHRRGIIHRDVQPQNILVNAARTEVQIIDFGLATRRAAAGDAGDVGGAEGAAIGTLAYMAPEQTGRMKRSVDARADLYALGCTLYQMLTGKPPFELTDELSLIHAHIARRPPPPHERAPALRIPEVVSAIAMRLLEKSPEQRYQTGEGAARDLERALEALRETGEIRPFPLGARDWENRIRRPSWLFGREREQQALREALARARGGATELALFSGPSGVGKSALLGALRDEARLAGGLFAAGKFDRLQRGTPHAALAQAFRAIARRRLSDSAEALERWTTAARAALGANARILVDMAPELARILGEPPALLEVSPAEAKHRFQLTVQRFVRATATAEHPLVLFIDDLQWADAPSLALLEAIATDPEIGHLLLLGAYRDGEVDGAPPARALPPLRALVEATRASGRRAEVRALGPLDEQALVEMVDDMLRGAGNEVRALCSLVRAKTDGSPFFVEQFLRALHEQRLLLRDTYTGRWYWEAERIERAAVTDNVVALLTEKMGRLPEEPRRMLVAGACVGADFEASLVSAAAGLPPEALRRAAEALLQEGLLVAASEGEGEAYAFVHDRVQQAAYELPGGDERPGLHLALARALDRRWSARGGDAELFALVHHYLRAAGHLREAAERRRAAERCLAAGLRAKAASAYAEAVRFLRAGRELLGADGGAADDSGAAAVPDGGAATVAHHGAAEVPDAGAATVAHHGAAAVPDAGAATLPDGGAAAALDFEILLALAETEWLAGQPEAGERLFAACWERARDAVARGRVALAQVPLLTVAGRYPEGVGVGLAALSELGWSFPREPEALAAFFAAQTARIAPLIAAMSPDSFRALPRCADPVARVAGELIGASITAAALSQPDLAASLIFAMPEIALVHGLYPRAVYGLSMSAVVLTGVLQDLPLGARCVELVYAARATEGLLLAGALHTGNLAGQLVHPDLAFVHAQWRDVPEIGFREGAITHSEVSQVVLPAARMAAGARLSSCPIPAAPWRDSIAGQSAPAFRAVHHLLTRADEADVRGAIRRVAALPASSPMTRVIVLGSAAFAAAHLGEDGEALRLALEVSCLWTAGWCNPPALWSLEILAILGAALPPSGDPAEDRDRRAALADQRARLERLAAFNPATFRHALLLAEAGDARAAGRHEEAERLFDEAIEHAHRQGFVHAEALGLRLAGEHLLARGRARMARATLRDAHGAYLRWEATGAAVALRRRHPEVFAAVEPADAAAPPAPARRTASATFRAASQLDVVSLLEAAQALASDRDPGSLIARMMRLLAENAGAERAVLVLARGDHLVVRAELTVEPERMALHRDEPALSSALLPATAVRYVARSREPLVLGRDGGDGRFDDDPYLQPRGPASLLLVPLLHQGRLLGVMVLEHAGVSGAFPEARVQVVSLLAAQAATAVENAALYSELSSSHQRLEQLVEERTAELKAAKEAADAASRAKSDFLASMSHELRTPLNGILGYAQILERLEGLSPRHLRAVQIIQSSGEHLMTLINDVLDLAKIEAGKLTLSPDEVHFPSFVQAVLGICQVRAEAKGLAFLFEQEGAALGTVIADQKRLMQVLLNLLGNAIKFTERGRVVLRVAASEAPGGPLAGAPRPVRFRVEDTGPGIAPEHLERIFEPFEQVPTGGAPVEGTGLGLAITRRIVDHMGGTLRVESQPGVGSVFEVEVPLADARAAPAASAPATQAAGRWARVTGYAGPRRAVLVVDDQAENRAVLRDMLAPLGFVVVEASGGGEALALASARRPDLVVMDLAMPELDGIETTRRLRRLPGLASVPVIASSASASEGDRARGAGVGCTDFLPKPVQLGALLEQLEDYLDLAWTRAEPPPRAAAPAPAAPGALPAPAAPGALPSAEVIAGLLDLVNRGRISGLLLELERLEREEARLGPFVDELRGLAKGFHVGKLRDALRAAAGPAAPVDVAPGQVG